MVIEYWCFLKNQIKAMQLYYIKHTFIYNQIFEIKKLESAVK